MSDFPPAAQRYAEIGFCPRCGQRYAESDFHPADCLYLCPACGFDFYQNPLPAAVVAIAGPSQPGTVLMLKRRTAPGLGLWCVPGGFIRYGETPEHAAMREAREEVGADIALDGVLRTGLVDYRYRGRQICVVEIAFAAHLAGPVQRASDEAEEIAFRPADALIAAPGLLAFPEQREVLIAFRDRFIAR